VVEEVVNIALLDVWWSRVLKFLGLFGSFWSFECLVDDGIGLRKKDGFSDVDLFSVNPEELFVFIICDSTTILHLTNHILQHIPFEIQSILLLVQGELGHYLIEVMLEVHQRRLKIRIVELVRHTPSQRTELSSFKNNRVKE
jgi:hypothetical protein